MIEVKNVKKKFIKWNEKKQKTEFYANKGISLEAHDGEIVGILGPNGAGKTTLLRMIAGILNPTEGEIFFDKKNYQENVKKINEDYKNDLLKIKEDRKNRKEIYLDKKAETKLKIKNADSSEVSELKEILKIYKKDIKAGDWKRRHKVKKDYKAKLAKANFDYEILINELTKQKSYVLEVKRSAERKEIEKTINKDNRYLNRKLRKERHLTRYRKNMNKAKRDAILGYAF